MHEKVR